MAKEKMKDEIAAFTDNSEDAAKIDRYRMGAAISFAVMLLVIGIPLWWKTTEVHRASLPYSRIEAIDPSSISIRMKIWVSAATPARTNDIIQTLKTSFLDHYVLSVDLVPLKVGLDDVTYETMEKKSSGWLPDDLGGLVMVEVPELSDADVLFTNGRLIYFTPQADMNSVAVVVKEHLLHDEDLVSKVMSILSPTSLSSKDDDTLNALRASLSYDVIVTIVNSDPDLVKIDFDVAAEFKSNMNIFTETFDPKVTKVIGKGYFLPLLDQIDDLSSHSVKSQWLYLLHPTLEQTPKMDSAGVNVISYSQLPHIITPLEKRLGSGISKNPCVHLVLYVIPCSQTPLKFLSESGDYVDSMISPFWGGIQLLNPSPEHCENGSTLIPNSREVLGLFTSQFHALLGVHHPEIRENMSISKRSGPLLRGWELDSLYRTRIVEQITSASITLQSLSKLLGEIGNIVINEDVAGSINVAVENVEEAKRLLEEGKLLEAVHFSKSAFGASERAFSDPSLLALLYFPDDQKYAVYIPLFLPIMIPVLMSLKKIYSWISPKTPVDTE